MTKTFAVRTELGANGQPTTQNDLYLDNTGDLTVASDLQAVLQACRCAAQALRGEMIFDQNRGIPNFQLIWNGVPNLIQYENELRNAFLNIDGVKEVVSLRVTLSQQVLKYTAIIKTIYGGGSING